MLAALCVELAGKDPDPAVFRAAVLALVQRFGGGAAVEQLLMDRAGSDDWAIRLPAVGVLAGHFGEDPRVRALLIDCARSDTEVQVRRTAVRGLGGTDVVGTAQPLAELRGEPRDALDLILARQAARARMRAEIHDGVGRCDLDERRYHGCAIDLRITLFDMVAQLGAQADCFAQCP